MTFQSTEAKTKAEYIEWVEKELIPLLMDAYGKPARYWRQAAKNAEQSIDTLPVYEDFDSTVERIRLLMINKNILTRAEIQDFGWIRSKWPWCVGILVRHALNHGPYPLASLGQEPHRDHVRQKVKKPEDEDIYVYCGRFAIDDDVRPEGTSKYKKKKRARKPYWPQDDEQSVHGASEPMKSQEDEKSVQSVRKPLKPDWSQNDIRGCAVNETPSRKELTSLLELLEVADVKEHSIGEPSIVQPTQVHQLPQRPQFGNHGLGSFLHSKKSAGLRAYQQWGASPVLEPRTQSPYIADNDGFPIGLLDQPYMHHDRQSIEMHPGDFLTPSQQPGLFSQPYQYSGMTSHMLSNQSIPVPYQYGAFGQSCREYGLDVLAPHQSNGSFDAHHQHSTPVLSAHSRAFENQGMPTGSSGHHLRIEADEFVLDSQGRRF